MAQSISEHMKGLTEVDASLGLKNGLIDIDEPLVLDTI